jgi:cytochrome c biogenesis protein CcmG/thiol:disulfide interchange protein DsbE
VTLGDYSGHVVVLNFWASWCGPCEDEAKTLEHASRRSAGEATFVGIDTRDSAGGARAFVKRHAISYSVLLDAKGATANDYGVQALPQTFVLDRERRIVRRFIGPVTEAQLRASIAKAERAE